MSAGGTLTDLKKQQLKKKKKKWLKVCGRHFSTAAQSPVINQAIRTNPDILAVGPFNDVTAL